MTSQIKTASTAADALIVTVRGYGYRLGIAPAEVAVED